MLSGPDRAAVSGLGAVAARLGVEAGAVLDALRPLVPDEADDLARAAQTQEGRDLMQRLRDFHWKRWKKRVGLDDDPKAPSGWR